MWAANHFVPASDENLRRWAREFEKANKCQRNVHMKTHTCLTRPTTTVSRRQVLQTAVGATAGLAGILMSKTPPLYAATRTVTMLTWNHFVEASDEHLRQMAREFGKANNCQVKIDFIPHRDTYVKVAKEQETREGHDIVFLFFSKPQLHHDDLETLDFMDDVGAKARGLVRSRARGRSGRRPLGRPCRGFTPVWP